MAAALTPANSPAMSYGDSPIILFSLNLISIHFIALRIKIRVYYNEILTSKYL